MVQKIQQANPWGRLGESIGGALADQVPKEVERNRMALGLKSLGEQKNLTPFQQFAALSSIPGITPQMVQSGSELLKQQQFRDSLRPRNTPSSAEIPQKLDIKNINLGGFDQNNQMQKQQQPQNVTPTETGQPQVQPKNPLREELKTVPPMTPEQKYDELSRMADRFPNATYPELNAMVEDNERRRMALPESERAEDTRLRETSDRLRSGFQALLEKKLQKQGPGTFSDITGAMQNNLVRGMERELVERPDLSEEDVINKWSEKGLDLAKAKKKLEAKAGSSLFATPILLNRDQYRKELEEFSDIYKDAGNSEEFYDTLKSDYGFSPMGAASLAFKVKPSLKSDLSKLPKGKFTDPSGNSNLSKRVALYVENELSPNDSILSIARYMLLKDPTFDKNAFIDQLREDKDRIGLNERQRRELTEAGQMFSTWPDILVLPITRG